VSDSVRWIRPRAILEKELRETLIGSPSRKRLAQFTQERVQHAAPPVNRNRREEIEVVEDVVKVVQVFAHFIAGIERPGFLIRLIEPG